MAWTYAGYRSEATDLARLTAARLHAQEITNAISADVSADGKSRNSGVLVQLLARVEKYIGDLEIKLGDGPAARPPVSMLSDFRTGTRAGGSS